MRICKAANVSSSDKFNFTVNVDGTGDQALQLGVGECSDITGSHLTVITESSSMPAGWAFNSIEVRYNSTLDTPETISGQTATVRTGEDRGRIVTFYNTFTGCTFTKGYYRNHNAYTASKVASFGGTITVGGAAINASQAQAILDATPGQPGAITFSSNNLLNLAQQVISAILNGGLSGPASVVTAINNANAGFALTGGVHLTSALSSGALGNLITPVDNFNNGLVTGYPHCGD